MTCYVFLVRHGEAAPGEPGLRDDLRPLTPKGRRQVRELGAGLKKAGIRFDLILHSPLLRAVETAELLTARLCGETRVEPRLAASPGPELFRLLEGERIALVGHEPHLGDLASLLVCGWKLIERDGEHGPFDFEKGSLCCLAGEPRPGGMRLVGLYSPSALRAFSAAAGS